MINDYPSESWLHVILLSIQVNDRKFQISKKRAICWYCTIENCKQADI